MVTVHTPSLFPPERSDERPQERELAGLGFHPAVAEWFARRFPEGPTPAQQQGWAQIARGRDIVRQIVSQGLLLTATGLAVGLAAAAALASVVGTLLYDVSPRDVATFVWTAAVLAGVATMASVIPGSVGGVEK